MTSFQNYRETIDTLEMEQPASSEGEKLILKEGKFLESIGLETNRQNIVH